MSNIVVAVDKTESSRKAVKEAAQLAEKLNSKLTVIHGVTPTTKTDTTNGTLVREGLNQAEERGQLILDGMHNIASEYDVNCSLELTYGDSPIEAVTGYITNESSEMLFIGHRCLSAEKEYYLGSFAKRILRESPIPVTIVS